MWALLPDLSQGVPRATIELPACGELGHFRPVTGYNLPANLTLPPRSSAVFRCHLFPPLEGHPAGFACPLPSRRAKLRGFENPHPPQRYPSPPPKDPKTPSHSLPPNPHIFIQPQSHTQHQKNTSEAGYTLRRTLQPLNHKWNAPVVEELDVSKFLLFS